MTGSRAVAVRSYRDVVDDVERRIFRVDRWRIPAPGGVPAIAVGYFAIAAVSMLVASGLPIVGTLLAPIQPALRLIGAPVLFAWALVSWQVDGRRPHHALWSWCRLRLGARCVAGMRRVPAVGTEFAPLDAITIAPCGDEPRYRAGRVLGPATLLIRYPARIALDGLDAGAGGLSSARGLRARRMRVSGLGGDPRPMAQAKVIRVPAGAEVRFE